MTENRRNEGHDAVEAEMADRPVVLVVDDNAPTRILIREFLLDRDVDSVEARDGEQAIALLGERDFDLVLLDILMPNRDGFEVLRWAAQQECRVPFVAMSQERAGSTQMSYAAMATSMGAVRGIDKPITAAKIADVLEVVGIATDYAPVIARCAPRR